MFSHLRMKMLNRCVLLHKIRDVVLVRYITALVLICSLFGGVLTLDPSDYCGLGPRDCVVLLCNYTNGTTFPCVFAPRNESQKVYDGSGGTWGGANINRLIITEHNCTGIGCCMTSINDNLHSPVNVLMQFLTGGSTPSFPVPLYTISIQGYEKCFPGKPYAANLLFQGPTTCLNLSFYCNFTVTTPITIAVTTTPLTTQSMTTPPITTSSMTTLPTTTPSSPSTSAVTSSPNGNRTATTITPTSQPITAFKPTVPPNNQVTTIKPITDQKLKEIVNTSNAVEISYLNLTQVKNETIIIKNVTSPAQATLSSTYFSGLTQVGAKDQAMVAVVATQFSLPTNVQNPPVRNYFNSLITNTAPFPGAPTLSVTIVDLITGKIVNGKLSYTIKLQNAAAEAKSFVQATVSNNSKQNGQFGVTRINKVETLCGFFNVTTTKFSTNGCSLIGGNVSSVSCHCDHTTLFAVLLSVQTYNIPSAVKLISYITESISVLCLVVTIATLTSVRKKVRSDRTVVQINLSISLLCFHVLNIVNEWALESKEACVFVTLATHYFLLANGIWMLLEGLTLYIKTTDRILSMNKKSPRKIALGKLLLGWGIPLLIVGLSAAIGFPTGRYMDESQSQQYREYLRCWVGNDYNALLASVFIPMAVIYLANVIIAARVIWFVHKLKSKELRPSGSDKDGNVENIGAAMKVFLMLFPVLGVPLIFAFFTSVQPYEASVVFMYINIILNGLQGFLLLLVYCVLASEVKEAVGRSYDRIKLRYSSDDPSKSQRLTSTYSTTVAS